MAERQAHLENIVAGEDITGPAMVRIRTSDGKAIKVSASDTTNPAQALVLTTVSNGATGQAFWSGIIDWPTSFTPGAIMYLSTTAGAITSTKPTNAQQIGYVTADGKLVLSIKPFEPVVEAPPTILTATATLDFGDVDEGGGIATLTVTVTGAAVGDVVVVQRPSSSVISYIHISGYVSSTNTVSVVCQNDNPLFATNVPSGTYKIKVFQ